MTALNELAVQMRERRTASALTQSELAQRLGVSQASVSLWEQGKATPTPEQVSRLTAILGSLVSDAAGITQAETQTPIAA